MATPQLFLCISVESEEQEGGEEVGDAKFEDPASAEVFEELLFKYGFWSGFLRMLDRGGAPTSDDMVGWKKGSMMKRQNKVQRRSYFN